MLSTPHLTPSWSSARSRKAQGPSVALDTPTVEERAWTQRPRIAQEHIDLRSMLGQFLCHASRKAPLLRKVLREKGHRSHGSMEGRLRVNGAVLIGCQVSAHAHAPRRLPSRLPCLPGPDNSELFHAELESRAVQSQARGRTLWSGENPLGLFHGGQNMRTIGFFQGSVVPTTLTRRGVGMKASERDL